MPGKRGGEEISVNVFLFRQERNREVEGPISLEISQLIPSANLRKNQRDKPSEKQRWREEAEEGRKRSTGSNSIQIPRLRAPATRRRREKTKARKARQGRYSQAQAQRREQAKCLTSST